MVTSSTGAPSVVPAIVVDLWPQTAASARHARHRVREALASWGVSALADVAELVVTELVTNAVQHSRTPGGRIETRCSLLPRSAGVRIEVHDGDAYRVPAMRATADAGTGGRGLHLVDALTHHMWGVQTREGAPGKLVWAHVGTQHNPSAYCEARARLGPALENQVLALDGAIAADLVSRGLLCILERGHADDHFAVVYDHLDGTDAVAMWTCWATGSGPAQVAVLPDCPASHPGGAGGCSLFASHPGCHTWQSDA